MNSCTHVKPVQATASAVPHATVETALLTVWGMGCPNCAMRVRNSLVKLDGVVAVYVDHAIGMAGVRFDPDQVQVQTLIDAVAQAGNDGLHEYGARLAALVGGGRRTTRPEPNAE